MIDLRKIILATTIIGALIWIVWPESGGWTILLALIPWSIGIIFEKKFFITTPFDFLIGLFLIFAIIASKISYAEYSAQIKLWSILGAVLLYYAIVRQSSKSQGWISGLLFVFGVSTSIYFFLTHDFIDEPRKINLINEIGMWWMGIRPSLDLPTIHPNYIAGLTVITSIYGVYPVWKLVNLRKISFNLILFVLGFSLVLLTLVFTTSRGIWMAIGCALGIFVIWKILVVIHALSSKRLETLFPTAVVVFLIIALLIIYLGPAQSGNRSENQQDYGLDSRSEIFDRSLSLIGDFPITGGGLGSFPGLYSHYILSIPNYYLPNSHNLFLDVGLEQGIISGIVFLVLYFGSVWHISKRLIFERLSDRRVFDWLILFSIVVCIVHGMVDNYLYNGQAAILSLSPIGLTMWAVNGRKDPIVKVNKQENYQSVQDLSKFSSLKFVIPLIFVLAIAFVKYKDLVSIWYANIGAIEMSRYDLMDFPDAGWDTGKNVNELDSARSLFERSLNFKSSTITSNYRLGLILMLRKEFSEAAQYLEIAHSKNPIHRGILKNLGFCYVWLNELDKAEIILIKLPEAQNELDVYTWWWASLGQNELSESASKMFAKISSVK